MPLEPDGGGGEYQEQLATVWDDIGDIFASLGETVASVPIIGGILSTPFKNTAAKFYLAGDTTRGFREFYDRLTEAFEALARGETWDEILTIVFPEWGLLSDFTLPPPPFGIDERLHNIIWNLLHSLHPYYLGEGVMELARLSDLIFDPVKYIRMFAPWAYQLWFDLSQFNTWQEFFEWLGEIGLDLFDPVAIISSVLNRIFQWIQEHIPRFTDWMLAVGEQILRYALEGKYVVPDIEPPIIE